MKVFAANLRDLLLAAPAGGRATIGLDPGFRTGVKVAVVDATGKIVETTAIYPHEPQRRWDESVALLAALAHRHRADLIAIGNGTASRETDKLAGDLIARHPELKLAKVVVSEAGASVYSASAYAAEELPNLDVTLRGAASIARRLQDPLAELVKIDPKSIGVGQYQHDLSEQKLGRSLDAVVEDCVNAVGVDVNTASAKLLARVSGVGEALAQAIVVHRETHGPFRNRNALKDVPRLGAKAFELSAGFLRINDGDQPLDRSGVHPEAYPVVRRILDRLGADIHAVIGNARALQGLKPSDFADARFGVPDGRRHPKGAEEARPRPPPRLQDRDVQGGGRVPLGPQPWRCRFLEGVVTNVAAFGVLVDVGVHQDGLVHVSAMANSFVKDPRAVAKPGDVVKVKVLSVDVPRKRISLTMRLSDPEGAVEGARPGRGDAKAIRAVNAEVNQPAPGGALAEALRRAAEKGAKPLARILLEAREGGECPGPLARHASSVNRNLPAASARSIEIAGLKSDLALPCRECQRGLFEWRQESCGASRPHADSKLSEPLAVGVETPRQIEAERATVPSACGARHSVCRMHGVAGGAPKRNGNALKHGKFPAETLALKREIQGGPEWQVRRCGRWNSPMQIGPRSLGEFRAGRSRGAGLMHADLSALPRALGS